MKIFLIYGDNNLKSYERLNDYINKAKEKGYEIQKLYKESNNIDKAISTNSLFNNKRIIIVEDINILSEKIIKWINLHKDTIDTNLIIYHYGTLSQKFISSLPDVKKIEEYKLPVLIWSFLDSFYPKNCKYCLILLHKIIINNPIEFIFSLLSKHLRDLYWAKIDFKTINYALWRTEKLQRQSSRFRLDELENIIKKMSEIDFQYKTTQDELINLLDLLIISYLK